MCTQDKRFGEWCMDGKCTIVFLYFVCVRLINAVKNILLIRHYELMLANEWINVNKWNLTVKCKVLKCHHNF